MTISEWLLFIQQFESLGLWMLDENRKNRVQNIWIIQMFVFHQVSEWEKVQNQTTPIQSSLTTEKFTQSFGDSKS